MKQRLLSVLLANVSIREARCAREFGGHVEIASFV